MNTGLHHPNEERLATLEAYEILDTPSEQDFDDIVGLVAEICEVPTALISFVDRDRQWFKAKSGLNVCETPLNQSICSHVVLEERFVEIPDTRLDARTTDNLLCRGDDPFLFYAGAPLMTPDGHALGALCALDRKPRRLNDLQKRTMMVMADRVMRELDLRNVLREQDLLRREIDHRTGNSLASVASIVALQAARSESAEVRDALTAVRARVGALAALHEELQQVVGGSRVLLDVLVTRGVEKIAQLLSDDIRFTLNLPPIPIESEEANAVALILNEFATNSGKHGNGSVRTICVDGHRTDSGGLTLSFADDGPADAQTLEAIRTSKGLGSKVIRSLTKSLGGDAFYKIGEPGLILTVTLPPKRSN